MALLSLWGAPPGVLLAAGGALLILMPMLRRGHLPGVVWTLGALLGLLRLGAGELDGLPGFRPATLAGAGPLVSVAAGLLCLALFHGVMLFENRRAPARKALGATALLLGAAIAGLFADSLAIFLSVAAGAQLLAVVLRPGGVGGLLKSGITGLLSVLVAVVSVGLLFQGWSERRLAGGADVHDWVGTPFSGDPPSSLLFCGLALPVLLPGIAGGVTHGFLWQRHTGKLEEGAEFSPVGSGLASLAVAALLLAGLHVQFNGADALGAWGIGAVGWALLAGGFAGWFVRQSTGPGAEARLEPPTDKRLAAWAQGAVGIILVSSSAASESAEAAFGYAVIATFPALGGLAIAAARLGFERSRHGGIGPQGMGRIFPSTMIFSGILALSLLAFPWTLGFLARSQGLGAVLVADGEEAGVIAVIFGLLIALLVAFPLLHGLFFHRGIDGSESPPRPMEPKAQRASLGLATALVVALGWAPDALGLVVPFTSVPTEAFPSVTVQMGALGLTLFIFILWTRFRSARFHGASDPTPGYPPAHEAK